MIENLFPSLDEEVESELAQAVRARHPEQPNPLRWADICAGMLDAVTKIQPTMIKCWHARAEVAMLRCDLEQAGRILDVGLQANPHSQQLAFAAGELLLQHAPVSGASRVDVIDEAIEHLERALTVDYQDQFQSDIDAAAVPLRLAQAYEVKATLLRAGETDGEPGREFHYRDWMLRAQGIYQQWAEEPSYMGTYAKERLRQIRTFFQVDLEYRPRPEQA